MADRLLLDGAMGTALLAAGLPTGALPETWLLSRPEAIRGVHASHAGAGAELLLTCTFNLAGPGLAGAGQEGRIAALASAAVGLARAAAPSARVAGALGPTALVAPGGRARPGAAELRDRYRAPFRALAAAGADLLWTESHWDLEEARVAVAAARATGLPVAVTFTPAPAAGALALPGGPPVAEAIRAMAADGAVAAGVNCLLPGADLATLAAALADLPVPLVVKPSAGLPGARLDPAPFAAWVAGAVRAGAAWVGGCCGAGPAHLRALAQLPRG